MIVARVAVRKASRDEVFFEIASRRAVGFAIKTLVVQAKKRNLDQAVVEQLHGLLKEMMIAGGIPVGSEPHDLVFVGVEIEAEVQREHALRVSQVRLLGAAQAAHGARDQGAHAAVAADRRSTREPFEETFGHDATLKGEVRTADRDAELLEPGD